MKHAFLILSFCFLSMMALANHNSDKNKKTLCGKVIDQSTGEVLVGVKVQVKNSNAYCYTDLNGNYILSVPADSKTEVQANVVGYETITLQSSELGYFKDISLSPLP